MKRENLSSTNHDWEEHIIDQISIISREWGFAKIIFIIVSQSIFVFSNVK